MIKESKDSGQCYTWRPPWWAVRGAFASSLGEDAATSGTIEQASLSGWDPLLQLLPFGKSASSPQGLSTCAQAQLLSPLSQPSPDLSHLLLLSSSSKGVEDRQLQLLSGVTAAPSGQQRSPDEGKTGRRHVTGWCPGSIIPGGNGQGFSPFWKGRDWSLNRHPRPGSKWQPLSICLFCPSSPPLVLTPTLLSLSLWTLPVGSHFHDPPVLFCPQLLLVGGACKRGAGLHRVLQGQRTVTSSLCSCL